ncbi:hypothetical protein MTO96_024633 [Rhipicephalus appendiculatus]
MAAIKPTGTLLLLGVWAIVLLGSCYAKPDDKDDFKEQDPKGSPTYLKMAHYVVSTQTKGKKGVRHGRRHRVVKGNTTYDFDFTTAPSNCTIGQVAYSAEKCRPAGPETNHCSALVHVVLPANTTTVRGYECD